MPETISIDGHTVSVVKPATVADLCQLVKQQRAKREAVYPVGGRTMLDFGLPPTKPGIAVDVTALNQVIDYPARDMTITVQAGITFAKLQATLAAEGQWLPLDVPDPERMTIGGLIACNVSGPRRYGYGTLRDYVIGIQFVNDDGDIISGGGRVVKNVAGYDLMKLHIGALGTMGVITQVTLKVKPKPETTAALICECDWLELETLQKQLQITKARPIAINCTMEGECDTLIVFEEKHETVNWQLQILQEELRDCCDAMIVEPEVEVVHQIVRKRIEAYRNVRFSCLRQYVFKPSDLPQVLDLFQGEDLAVSMELMNGILWSACKESVDPAPRLPSITVRAPTAWKTPERVFGKPTPAFELMRHIKRTLDPDDVFNPGRMFAFQQ